jgi:hypothetical protein
MIQLIVVSPITSSAYFAPSKPGDVVWVKTEAIARQFIELGLCKLPSVPDEAKETAPRKSAGEASLGRSIVSPSSTAHGRVRLSLSSAAVLVSPQRI